jgi:hypothetical protein
MLCPYSQSNWVLASDFLKWQSENGLSDAIFLLLQPPAPLGKSFRKSDLNLVIVAYLVKL